MNVERTLILGRFDDLGPGEMRSVEVGGKNILLVRRGDRVSAIGGECPHAGAPLAEGVLAGDQVICPWHKAAFCVRTGALREPPAVDDLPAYAIDIIDGDIVLRDAAPVAKRTLAADGRHFVILGAGAAGFSAARELREIGFAGAVTMVSREAALPYDRTLLSKYFLSGRQGGEKTPLQEAAFFEEHRITRLQAEVSHLDPQRKTIRLSDGRTLSYDAALIATGSGVVPPAFPGGGLANVFTLRSQADAAAILSAAENAREVVVIGAGFIGMEVAAALAERELSVAVVGSEQAPFAKQLGADVGNVYRRIHEEHSVRFRLGARVARLEGGHAVCAVVLEGGERLAADLVVIGLGAVPETGFVPALTRSGDQALAVDSQLRVAEDLYAAGDVAAFPDHSGGRIRVEHWRVAQQHGAVAARNMAGATEAFTAVPVFWTIQYMIRLDYVGHASGDDPQVIRGSLEARSFIAYSLRDGIVTAAAGMGRDREMAAVIALMTQRRDWAVDALHPPGGTPLDVLRADPQTG